MLCSFNEPNKEVSYFHYIPPAITLISALGTILAIITLLGAYQMIGVGTINQIVIPVAWGVFFLSLTTFITFALLSASLCLPTKKDPSLIPATRPLPPNNIKQTTPNPKSIPQVEKSRLSQENDKAFLSPKSAPKVEQEREVSPSGLYALPDETLLHLFSFLPTYSLYTVREVSQRFRAIVEEDGLWQERGERLNRSLGPEASFFGHSDKLRVKPWRDQSWFNAWRIAQAKDQTSVREGSSFIIKDGQFYSSDRQGLSATSCDGDYQRKFYTLSFLQADLSRENSCFDVRGDRGVIVNPQTKKLTFFSLSLGTEYTPSCFDGEEIRTLHLGEEGSLLTGMAQGGIKLWKIVDQQYQCIKDLPHEIEALTIRHSKSWIACIIPKEESYEILLENPTVKGLLKSIPRNPSCAPPSFDLSDEFLVIGYDNKIYIFDFKNHPTTFPCAMHTIPWAEIHSVEIVDKELHLAFSRKGVGVNEDGTAHWVYSRSFDSLTDDHISYIDLSLYTYPLSNISEKFDLYAENTRKSLSV